MYQKLFFVIIILISISSCSKKEVENFAPADSEMSYLLYREAVKAMNDGDIFVAAKKFSEASLILPKMDDAAKASIMSSYCLYLINFYEESTANLENFILKYPANKNIPYAYYLVAMNSYEQILDERKDLEPLLISKKKIEYFLENYPNTEYAMDLKFKMDLINNQLAAKELYVAKYYIKVKKWIPAINRLKKIVEDYEETVFIEEALHRLVEIYYEIGLNNEAKAAASLLGYNYNSSEWYEQSYRLLNKNYKIKTKKEKNKNDGLIKRTIKKILG